MSDHPTNQTTDRPAMIPPGAVDPASICRVCRGQIGIYCWSDRKGKAHPWCVGEWK